MDVKILLKLLEDQADPAKLPHMEAYMKNIFRFLGVQKTILRKIERDYFKLFMKDPIDWNFVEECWQQPYREFQYIAILSGRLLFTIQKPRISCDNGVWMRIFG